MTEDQIIKSFNTWLIKEASTLSSNGENIDDLIQEGRIAMWRAFKTFNPDRGYLTSWLTYNAKNRMRTCVAENIWEGSTRKPGNRLLKYNPCPISADNIPESVIIQDVDLSYHSKEIARAVKNLTRQQRKYVYMKFWQDYAQSDILKEFGYSPTSLWSSKTYGAKERLKRSLAHLEDLV